MKLIISLIFSLWFFVGSAWGSELSTKAAALTNGQFVELTTTNISSGGFNIFETGSGGFHILQYYGKSAWKPSANGTGEFYTFGSSHNGPFINRFIKYVESTNTWSLISTSQADLCPGQTPFCVTHGYDHQDIYNGIYYHRENNSFLVHRYDIAAQAWISDNPPFIQAALGAQNTVGAFTVFPNLGASGSLLYIDSYTGVSAYSPKKQLIVFTGANGHGIARYDIATGGVSKVSNPQAGALYKMNASGTITQLTNPPCTLSTNDAPPHGFLIPDPVSGNFIVFCRSGVMYSLNPDSDTYTNLNVTLPFTFNTGSNQHTFVPIPEYDVIMFIDRESQSSARVWLYKPPASDTFATRCAAAGVLRCFDFDDDTELGGMLGDNFGRFASGATCASGLTNCPTIDTAVKASGAGSLKFTIPTLSGDSGVHSSATQWFANFSTDLSAMIGAGESFWVQWRQRVNPAMLGTFWQRLTGDGTLTLSATSGTNRTATSTVAEFASTHVGRHIFTWEHGANGVAVITGYTSPTQVTVNITTTFTSTTWTSATWGTDRIQTNWKYIIIGQGDVVGSGCSSANSTTCAGSCTVADIVGTTYFDQDFPIVYQSCGEYEGIYDDVAVPGSIKLQNNRPSPFCKYNQNPFPPDGTCFPFTADNWMTFMIHVQFGVRSGAAAANGTEKCNSFPARCFMNSHVDVYASNDGEVREHLVNLDWNYHVGADGSCVDILGSSAGCEVGKVWLTPFMTGKSKFQDHPTLNIWYDELIISTQEIAWPSATTTSPPATPTGFKIK